MAHFLQRFKQKLKHNSIWRVLFDGLVKINIKITPYYLVLEGLPDNPLTQYETGFDDYDVCFLGPDDMQEISLIPDQLKNAEELIQMLNNGLKCVGLKINNRLAAFTWCDLEKCNLEWRHFKLAPDEAYLFDAYTLIEFRGRGLAPFVRYQLYKELAKQNRTKLYSISAYFNQQSINFKRKLNARFVDLSIYIGLFKKIEFSFLIKKYS